MKEIIYIFIGGGTGSVLRYLVHLLINEKGGISNFPWATFIVNIAGSLLIGIFYSISERFHLPSEVRLFLTVGLCGGFTTFSTFSNESLWMLKEGWYTTFFLYVILSIGLSIAAVIVGSFLAK